MAATIARDEKLWDEMFSVLQTIAQPGPIEWLCPSVFVAQGPVPDSLPENQTRQVYIDHLTNAPPPEAAVGTRLHTVESTFVIYMYGETRREVMRLHADVRRALYGAEGTLITATGCDTPPWPTQFAHNDEMIRAGYRCGQLLVVATYSTDHLTT